MEWAGRCRLSCWHSIQHTVAVPFATDAVFFMAVSTSMEDVMLVSSTLRIGPTFTLGIQGTLLLLWLDVLVHIPNEWFVHSCSDSHSGTTLVLSRHYSNLDNSKLSKFQSGNKQIVPQCKSSHEPFCTSEQITCRLTQEI